MFIEHMPDPKGSLSGIYANLVEGAPGIVEVPSLDYLIDNSLGYEFMLDHLHYFTTESMRLLLETSGFGVERMERVRDSYVICAEVRKRTLSNFSVFARQLDEVKFAFAALKERCPVVDIWGAGHQALYLLAQLPSGSVRYVYDSAPFKQGKVTPVLRIPIVPPPDIPDSDAVIAIAGGYSREIGRILQGKAYGGAVYIFEDNKFKEVTVNG
ncbi:hypothetical protein AGMMS50276_32290 [Synergistales bacterium]|nr:hypothetical protein AGMMS50276_32290 [Synergistales bacterium]